MSDQPMQEMTRAWCPSCHIEIDPASLRRESVCPECGRFVWPAATPPSSGQYLGRIRIYSACASLATVVSGAGVFATGVRLDRAYGDGVGVLLSAVVLVLHVAIARGLWWSRALFRRNAWGTTLSEETLNQWREFTAIVAATSFLYMLVVMVFVRFVFRVGLY